MIDVRHSFDFFIIGRSKGLLVLTVQHDPFRRGIIEILVASLQGNLVLLIHQSRISPEHCSADKKIDKEKQQEFSGQVEGVPYSQTEFRNRGKARPLLFRFLSGDGLALLLHILHGLQFLVLDDSSVPHHDAARGVGLSLLIVVGDHDDKLVTGDFVQCLHHQRSRLAVQVSCRFVRDNNRRVLGEGSRDGHSLLLSSGKSGHSCSGIVPKSQPAQNSHDAGFQFSFFSSVEQHRQLHVLIDSVTVNQVIILKNISDIGFAVVLVVFCPKGTGILSGNEHFPLLVGVQAGNHVQQC